MNKAKTTLIFLPYAGGSTNCFEPLCKHLPQDVQTLEVTLPGRGKRYAEPLLKDMDALTADIWQQVSFRLGQPYILFGHSMGSLLAYLLCHKIRQAGLPAPLHLFLSGREAPCVPDKEPAHLLSYQDFKAKLDSYGGIAPEVLDDEAFAFFEPMIRADFQAVGTWQYRPRPRLNVSVTVLWGTEEDNTQEEVEAWQKEFTTEVRFEVFEGGHFFLFEYAQTIAGKVAECLQARTAMVF